MNSAIGILAQITSTSTGTSASPITGWWGNLMQSGVKEAALILGGLLVVGVILFVAVKLMYRRPHRSSRAKYPKYEPTETGETARVDGEEKGEKDRSHRHRRRRRDHQHEHRGRNPTLSETGGLPPLRDPGQNPDV
jgi:hypothetical protein